MPSMLSTLMSLSNGIKSLLPLTLLNSSMFATEANIVARRLQGDWNVFLHRHGLQEGIGTVFHAG